MDPAHMTPNLKKEAINKTNALMDRALKWDIERQYKSQGKTWIGFHDGS